MKKLKEIFTALINIVWGEPIEEIKHDCFEGKWIEDKQEKNKGDS